MKVFFTITLLWNGLLVYGQHADTSFIQVDEHSFYQIQSEGNAGIIVFLHGGVTNPAFANPSHPPGLDFLLEGNTDFIQAALDHKFDILVPVVDTSLNWLTNQAYCFQIIKKHLASRPEYSRRLIAGFSDGGTGSYKIFYTHRDYFHGLMVFNGYPQHGNFNKEVQYSQISSKKIVFCSTEDDKVIPYEFLLTEYCRQKIYNADTYLYVVKGNHTFQAYNGEDFKTLFDLMTPAPDNKQTKAIQGFVTQDRLVAFYAFRTKIFKKYTYGKEFYEENVRQSKAYAH